MAPEARRPSQKTAVVMALAAGVSVANLYYCQPLLTQMGQPFGVGHLCRLATCSSTAGWSQPENAARRSAQSLQEIRFGCFGCREDQGPGRRAVEDALLQDTEFESRNLCNSALPRGFNASPWRFLRPTLEENQVNSMEQVGIEYITPSPTSNGAQDTFYPDWHWSLGDWRRKVGHEGNE